MNSHNTSQILQASFALSGHGKGERGKRQEQQPQPSSLQKDYTVPPPLSFAPLVE